jgi:hypothetical protein
MLNRSQLIDNMCITIVSLLMDYYCVSSTHFSLTEAIIRIMVR